MKKADIKNTEAQSDKQKALAKPFAIAENSVSCNAGCIIYNRKSFTAKLIEKC